MENEKEHKGQRKMFLKLVKGQHITDARQVQEKISYDLNLIEIRALIEKWVAENPGEPLLKLANLAGTTESTLSRIRRGETKNRPHYHTRKAIVDAVTGARREDKPAEDAMDSGKLQSIENRLEKLEMAIEYIQKQIDLIAGLPNRPTLAGPLNRMKP